MKKSIFLPNPVNQEISCLGERWFCEKKFWKLAILLGYGWSSNVLINRGLSFTCILQKNVDEVNKISDNLTKLGIKHKKEWSDAGWQYILVISGRKANLELIDNLYKKFYNKKIREFRKNKENIIKIKSDYMTREYFEEVYGNSSKRDKYLAESKF